MSGGNEGLTGQSAEGKLRRYRLAGEQIEWLIAEMRRNRAQEEELALGAQARPLDGMPRGKGMRSDPTLRAAQALLEKGKEREAELLRRIRELTAEREEVDRLLEELEGDEQRIIRLRRMEGKSWVQIAMRVYRCERQCQRIYRRGIERIDRALAARSGQGLGRPAFVPLNPKETSVSLGGGPEPSAPGGRIREAEGQ